MKYSVHSALCANLYLDFQNRLRDMAQETEQDQRKRISELEKDVVGLSEMQCDSLHMDCGLTSLKIVTSGLRICLDQAFQR